MLSTSSHDTTLDWKCHEKFVSHKIIQIKCIQREHNYFEEEQQAILNEYVFHGA